MKILLLAACLAVSAATASALACAYPSNYVCPPDCGKTTAADGCIKCTCGARPVAPPNCYPEGSRCPPDCGQKVEGGCVSCLCGAKPLPPVAPTEEPEICYPAQSRCPPRCGKYVTEGGCAVCTCGATPITPGLGK